MLIFQGVCQMPHMHERTRMYGMDSRSQAGRVDTWPPIIEAKRASKDWGGPDVTMSQKNGSQGITSTDSEKTGKVNLKKGSTGNSNTDFFTLKMYF